MKEKISLNGEYELRQKGGKIKIFADVPGTVFENLYKKRVIPDPFYGTNEKELSWVFDSDWEFKKIFDLKPSFLEKENIFLRFYGLDTIAEIVLNGNSIANTNNMHRIFDFEVKSPQKNLLKESGNELKILFISPTKEALRIMKEINAEYYRDFPDPSALPGVEMLRKAYYSFGWDWGPKLPDSGIWRDVELIGFDTAAFHSVSMDYSLELESEKILSESAKRAEITLVPKFFFPLCEIDELCKECELEISLTPLHGKKEEEILYKSIIPAISKKISFTVDKPKLWWIKELSEPFLYVLQLKLKRKGELIDTYRIETGFRKLELVREKDNWGEPFYFCLNNVPLFAKGANWVPIDSFLSRGKKKKLYTDLLDIASQANFNMLRVWGGGIYEDEEFYNICDRKGLLVWQDFAFACKPTPSYIGFLENIEEEASQNILRLKKHPSLAIWVGNNEIEEGWVHWWFEKAVPDWKENYLKIFENLLPSIVTKLDPSRPYWPSSPSSGGNFNDTLSPDKGDSHYWMVWHAGYSFHSYRSFNSRFMSEFGFESFPDIKTVKEFCPEDQLSFDSPAMENHQKNSAGNKKIMDYMEKEFSIPYSFENQIILSQITQARAMQYGIEHWRINKNENRCMGTLYWQFNDCWPVASWSAVDYNKRLKALFYFSKRVYEPLTVFSELENNILTFYAVNDLTEGERCLFNLSLSNSEGKILYSEIKEFLAEELKSTKILNIDLSDFIKKFGLPNILSKYSLKMVEINQLKEYFDFYCTPKELILINPALEYKLVNCEGKKFTIEITAKEHAFFVGIFSDSLELLLSDNYFNMRKGDVKSVFAVTEKEISEKEIYNKIKIKSLFDYRE